MADKEIVDGADATIIAELDEAAEARIIDVLSKVFVTNKYPGLRAAILDGAERYKQQREMEEKQRFMEQAKYQNVAKQLQNSGAMHNDNQIDSLKREMQKQAATQAAPAINPFDRLTRFGNKYW